MKATLITLLLAMLLPTAPADETGSVFGVITDTKTGDPLAYANVVIVDKRLGAMSLTDGTYRITGVPAGTYDLKAMMMGYTTEVKRNVVVEKGNEVEVNFAMQQTIVGQTQEIVVEAELPEIDVTDSDATHRRTRTEVENLEVDDVAEALAFKSGIVKTGGELHVRGGRSGKSLFRVDCRPVDDPLGRGSARCRPHVPCFPLGQYYNTEEYARIVENDFLDVIGNPLSTFSIDVDAASYGNTRRFIMHDRLPPEDAVRIEEFINYFDYDYERPVGGKPFSINLEYASCPWNPEHGLVHIGLRGEELAVEDQKPSNLVFLIDVSGSMQPENNLPLLRKAFTMLVDQLKDDDRVSIVVYASAAGLVLPSTPGSEKGRIKHAIDNLYAGGSTAGCAGIKLAYKIAKENYIHGGNNRVVLATDGDFNVGVSSTSELVRLIEEKRDEGIFLTVLGFGIGNYKDHRLEQLADKGNGNHAYIDNILEAKKVLVDGVTATLYTIAKDVKIQVEFNPAKVSTYRLIGYENRLLKKEDFDDDKKDAGEIGAGHTVTALYEIVPAGGRKETLEIKELKYMETAVKREAWNSDEILTVRIRYKDPDGDTSKLITTALKGGPANLEKSSENFRFSAAVAMYAMILRDSQYKGDAKLYDVSSLAKSAIGDDPYTYRAEFLRIVERTKILTGLASR
jgi:Ca-activated chloride channel family protein